ncbi:MAG: hypothetical protein JJU23_09085 [Cyclobacteriaceae bacterium]|nr:hypothetical protein [Cyclobacteriaceae bacterium]
MKVLIVMIMVFTFADGHASGKDLDLVMELVKLDPLTIEKKLASSNYFLESESRNNFRKTILMGFENPINGKSFRLEISQETGEIIFIELGSKLFSEAKAFINKNADLQTEDSDTYGVFRRDKSLIIYTRNPLNNQEKIIITTDSNLEFLKESIIPKSLKARERETYEPYDGSYRFYGQAASQTPVFADEKLKDMRRQMEVGEEFWVIDRVNRNVIRIWYRGEEGFVSRKMMEEYDFN